MDQKSDPPDPLVSPGPPVVPEPAPESPQRTGALSVDEWLARNTGQSAVGTTYNPYEQSVRGHAVRGSQTMAGWALGLSLALCVPFVFLLGAGLAITVLVRSHRHRINYGKRKAIAALVIAGLVLAANVAYAVVVIFNGVDETERDSSGRVVEGGTVTLDRLRVGDCFNGGGLDGLAEDGTEGEAGVTADVVPCGRAHQAEVYYQFDIESDGYPGDAAVQSRLTDCLSEFRNFVRRSYQRSQLEIFFLYPSSATWRLGDHEVVCIVADPDLTEISGSLAGSRR